MAQVEMNLNIEASSLSVTFTTEAECSLIDWILCLEDLAVALKVRFADQVVEEWEKKKKLSEEQKTWVNNQLMKLAKEHPNFDNHKQLLQTSLNKINEKLDTKHRETSEHLN